MGASSLAMTGALMQVDFSLSESTANILNPFYGFVGQESNLATLYLDDGGLNLQNIPLIPLLHKLRKMDAILAVDSSDDIGDGEGICCGYNWPNGTSLVAAYEYALTPKGQQQLAMPYIPSLRVFAEKQLNYHPTFFGCNSKDSTNPKLIPPLIIYLPNAPYTAWSNGTTGASVVSIPHTKEIAETQTNLILIDLGMG
jgi:lysophospholipase